MSSKRPIFLTDHPSQRSQLAILFEHSYGRHKIISWKKQIRIKRFFKMKLTALILAALPAATSAFTFSIAQGLPIRRSVAKFTDDKVPEDAVTKAAEGKWRQRRLPMTEINWPRVSYHPHQIRGELTACFLPLSSKSRFDGAKPFPVGTDSHVRSRS